MRRKHHVKNFRNDFTAWLGGLCYCSKEPEVPCDSEEPVVPGDSEEPVVPGDSEEPEVPGDSEEPVVPGDSEEGKKKKKGCGSSLGLGMAGALTAVGAALVIKKRKED